MTRWDSGVLYSILYLGGCGLPEVTLRSAFCSCLLEEPVSGAVTKRYRLRSLWCVDSQEGLT